MLSWVYLTFLEGAVAVEQGANLVCKFEPEVGCDVFCFESPLQCSTNILCCAHFIVAGTAVFLSDEMDVRRCA